MIRNVYFTGDWQASPVLTDDIVRVITSTGVRVELAPSEYRGVNWEVVAKVADVVQIASAVIALAVFAARNAESQSAAMAPSAVTLLVAGQPNGPQLSVDVTTPSSKIEAFIENSPGAVIVRIETK